MFEDFDFTDEAALQALVELLSDAPASERAEAAIRLGPIMELASEGDSEDISDEVGRRVAHDLRQVYEDESAPMLVRRRCLEASVRWPSGWQAKAVRQALDTPGDWRITGLFCAGFVPGFTEDLRAGVRSDEEDEVVEALTAIGNAAIGDLAGLVLQAAGDPDSSKPVRLAAIEALGLLGDDRALEVLDDLTSHRDAEIADAAEEALAEWSLMKELDEFDDDFED